MKLNPTFSLVAPIALLAFIPPLLGADLAADAGLTPARRSVSHAQGKFEITPVVQALRDAAARKDWPAVEALCSESLIRSAYQAGDAPAFFRRVLAPALRTDPNERIYLFVRSINDELLVEIGFWSDPIPNPWSVTLREEGGAWKFTRL